ETLSTQQEVGVPEGKPERQKAMAATASLSVASLDVNTSANESLRQKNEILLQDLERWRSRVKKRGTELPGRLDAVMEELRQFNPALADSSHDAATLYEKWQALGFSAAAMVIDHTDEHIDPRRDHPEWQAVLARILETAGIQKIQ